MIEVVKLFIIVWVFKDLFEFIGGIIYDVKFKNKWVNIVKSFVAYILSCHKCSSVWFSLILSGGDLFMAALIGLLVQVLNIVFEKLKLNDFEL